MQFTEDGLIMYPYIDDNKLYYEVNYDTSIIQKVQYLPDLQDNEQWTCYGVDIDEETEESTITVAPTNKY